MDLARFRPYCQINALSTLDLFISSSALLKRKSFVCSKRK